MDRRELIDFVRACGPGVIATRGPDGSPQAALAATDQGEIVFDCSRHSRKYANIVHNPAVALVAGWDNEVTVQVEGSAQILSATDLERCKTAYFEQYPDGRDRAASPEIAHICVAPQWLRHSDYRPDTFGSSETPALTAP